MLTLTGHNLGDMVILRCADRIVRGEETAILCAGAQQQGRSVILDLSGVDAIDAAGIGLLVSLQAAGIYLKLMNPTKQVRENCESPTWSPSSRFPNLNRLTITLSR